MKPNIDFGKLSEEETKQIAIDALQELTPDTIAQVLHEAIEEHILMDIAASLFTDD